MNITSLEILMRTVPLCVVYNTETLNRNTSNPSKPPRKKTQTAHN